MCDNIDCCAFGAVAGSAAQSWRRQLRKQLSRELGLPPQSKQTTDPGRRRSAEGAAGGPELGARSRKKEEK